MNGEGAPHAIDELHFARLGAVDERLAHEVVSRVSRAVSPPCRLLPAPFDVELAVLPGRVQADADRLLADVEASATTPGAVLVALTAHDMGSPIFTHFFGRSRLNGRAAVVSLARLSPKFYGLPDDPAVTVRRATEEVVHELGHLAGLRHCDVPSCLMRFAYGVEAIDVRGSAFCRGCGEALTRRRLIPQR